MESKAHSGKPSFENHWYKTRLKSAAGALGGVVV
jgi:hypothetical protein